MSDELRDALLRYLTGLEAELVSATEFAKDQAPLLVQELLQWTIVSGGLWALVGAVVFVVSARRLAAYRPSSTVGVWEASYAAPVFLLPLFTGAVGAVMMVANARVALKVWLAPRVFLLDFVGNMVR